MQLSTFDGFGYQPFDAPVDGVSYLPEFSTVWQGIKDLAFDLDKYQKNTLHQLDKATQQVLEHLSTYSPAVIESVEAQALPLLSAEEIIDTTKKVTGLSVKDLAGIFQVTRQSLYNFRGSEATIGERNWKRLQAVSREIESISAFFTSSPGSLMKRAPVDGQTLYQLLCADVLDTARIEQLAKHVAKQLKTPSDSELRSPATIEELTRHA